jgi:hypothetical protein
MCMYGSISISVYLYLSLCVCVSIYIHVYIYILVSVLYLLLPTRSCTSDHGLTATSRNMPVLVNGLLEITTGPYSYNTARLEVRHIKVGVMSHHSGATANHCLFVWLVADGWC